ncbi:hypothetical protein M9Y10_029351 [Tritrichomonas musculus]|uniref:RING-type domain-containing protein n=1 Tax=Tritrichomonas musculus TaxID=1915356 RepID=A0ABR2KMT0_9EUKA
MTVFSLDQLPSIISQCTEYKDQLITFTDHPDIDLSAEELKITSDLSITFPPHEFACKRIFISNCKVVFRNLVMSGSIRVENGALQLFDSTIQNPDESIDYILSVQSNSTVEATGCTFSGTAHFGVSGDEHSNLSFDHCTFKKIALYGIALTCFSILKCSDSTFQDLEADAIFVADHCGASIIRCEFTGSQKRALTVKNADYLNFDHSIVKNCTLSAFYVSNCDQFLMNLCTITDCSHTAIYLEHVTGVVKKTIISNCNGNGVNASHSSKVLILKCNFSKTSFPSIAICESSFGSIQKCEMVDSEMSGLIVRSNSNACIEKTTIQNAKLFGISVSDSKEVIVKNSFILKCKQSAIAVYNNSRIKVESTNLVGPCTYGINCFTGGFVTALDTTILGMSESAIWLHHSGSGIFEKIILSPRPIADGSDIVQLINEFNLEPQNDNENGEQSSKQKIDQTKLIKNESKRLFLLKSSFVVGLGYYEAQANIDSEEAPSGVNYVKPKCILCGSDASNCIYTRCGHSVYCRECYDQLEKKPEVCDLCLMPVGGVVSLINCSYEGDDGVCSICFTNQVDTVVLPCGHTMCYECAIHWFQSSIECPFCREKNSRPQLFVSYE